ncbi:MAG: ABC transporter substrate-binding protein [Xanthobacteraceae bacterium]
MDIQRAMRALVSGTAAVALVAGPLCTATTAFAASPPSHTPPNWTAEKTDCTAMGLVKSPPWTIGVSNFSLGNSWRVQMIEELKAAAAKDSRIKELVITNADGNVAKQLSDIEDLRSRNVVGLLITPLSADGLVAPVEEAYADHVATIIFNDRVSTSKFHGIVWSDEYKFGWIGGNWLKEKLGGKGNIVMLDGIAGSAVNDLRAQGGLDALGPNIKVLARQPADWAYDKGKAAMEDLLSAYPKIDGVYSQGGAMSQGAVDAFLAANRPLVPMPGEGYNGFLKTWVKNKAKGFSSVAPDEPTWQSAQALQLMTTCLSGGTINKWTELELPIITDDTVQNYVRLDCPDDVWSNTKMSHEEITKLYKCKP